MDSYNHYFLSKFVFTIIFEKVPNTLGKNTSTAKMLELLAIKVEFLKVHLARFCFGYLLHFSSCRLWNAVSQSRPNCAFFHHGQISGRYQEHNSAEFCYVYMVHYIHIHCTVLNSIDDIRSGKEILTLAKFYES